MSQPEQQTRETSPAHAQIWCYVAVVRDDGYFMARADLGTRGYRRIDDLGAYPSWDHVTCGPSWTASDHGPMPSLAWEQALKHQKELNRALGLTDLEALAIILDTMRPIVR